jgi:hypothetical protein
VGRFQFTVPDKANLLAVLPRDLPPEFPSIAAGGDQKVEVTLRVGHIARGRIIDDTGKPIPNVQVIAVVPSPDSPVANPYWLTESAVHTDAEGKFVMTGVPEGALFDFLKFGLSPVRNHKLDLDAADNGVTMTISSGGAVSGRVVDRDGKPIRNFRVLVGFPRERAGRASNRQAFSPVTVALASGSRPPTVTLSLPALGPAACTGSPCWPRGMGRRLWTG